MLQSLLGWLSKLSQGTTVNKQGRSDAPASHPLAEAVPTKPPTPPTMAKGTESHLIDTPPPSYEDLYPGPVEAGIGAVTDAQLVPQDSRSLKIVDVVMRRVDKDLKRLKQVTDVDCVSSGIRQFCFAACRVSQNYQGHSNATLEERRQTNHSEIDKLFRLIVKPTTLECLTDVVVVTTNALKEIAEQVMAETKYSNQWKARREFHFMRSSIYRAAARVCTQLAEDKTSPPSTLASLDFGVIGYDRAANSFVRAAEYCTYYNTCAAPSA